MKKTGSGMNHKLGFAISALIGVILQSVAVAVSTWEGYSWVVVAGLAGAGAIALAFAGGSLVRVKRRSWILGACFGLLSIPGLVLLVAVPARIDDPDLLSAPKADPRLISAAASDDADQVAALLDGGAPIDGRNRAGQSVLHLALDQGHTAVVELLLARGASITARDKMGNTPLHVVAELGDSKLARLLLDKGAEVDAAGNDGWTPLHLAASWGSREVARLLMERGASRTSVNDKGNTPAQQAKNDNHPEMAELLETGGSGID